MRIKADLYDHSDTRICISSSYLSELPTTLSNIITPDNNKYRVLQTMFTKKYEGGFYEFQQIIANLPKGGYKNGYNRLPTFLLKGTIIELDNYLFRDIKLAKIESGYYKVITEEVQHLPYGHLREYDMLRISEDKAVYINNITVLENEICIDYPGSEFTIGQFQTGDKVHP